MYNKPYEYRKKWEKYNRATNNKIAELLLANNISPSKILDFGAGAGSCLLSIAKTYPSSELFAVDNSPDMLLEIERLFHLSELQKPFASISLDELTIPSNKFDLVISNSVLHHIEEPIGWLADIVDVMSSNGFLIITDYNTESLYIKWYKRFIKAFDSDYNNTFSTEDMVDLASSNKKLTLLDSGEFSLEQGGWKGSYVIATKND